MYQYNENVTESEQHSYVIFNKNGNTFVALRKLLWWRENGEKNPLGGTMKPEINYENVKNILLALVCESGRDWNLFFLYMLRNESAADGIC